MEKRYLGIKELAEYLGINRNRLFVGVYKNPLSEDWGRLVKFDLRKIDQWTQEKAVEVI